MIKVKVLRQHFFSFSTNWNFIQQGSFFADPAAIPETSIDVEASEAQNNA